MKSDSTKHRYFAIYKPYGMLSQFTPEAGHRALGELYKFPKDVYPVGRLDTDSEGLLILTNDTALNKRLLDPKNGHLRTYHAQVEGVANHEHMNQLIQGVTISSKGKEFHVKATNANVLDDPGYDERVPPIRFRLNVPTSWIELTITEGKNRQVRKMTAAVQLPTLRLVRVALGELNINHLQGQPVKEMTFDELKSLIFNK